VAIEPTLADLWVWVAVPALKDSKHGQVGRQAAGSAAACLRDMEGEHRRVGHTFSESVNSRAVGLQGAAEYWPAIGAG
jgi:hypothetical protein